ncbi:pyridoxal-phosphate dependent enzyme [Candidatus Halobonum tyrrellensis]|uniref:Threonine synthase n=1 Tax=Candidatus Halobonum tyrrellensis G22 TaxID=1324957 RepID=V4IZB2_9EURY|nr:pyridoxal-phosphate dependent enzyme [Candidatus Halobonum tyrrellensis]ESP88457.1 threonine synthase [Candidatus Halobonum tyrrellensis G22]
MLTCYACGARAESGQRCDCGEPLWYETDPAGVAWPDADAGGVWAFESLLPVGRPESGLATAAGGTPLVRAPTLDADGARVHVKLEGTNPTGSFKDRGSAVGVTAALAAGRERVGTVSHGNMAASMAANAAGTDLDCVVLVPADIPDERLARIGAYGPRVVRVEGDYGRLYHDSLDVAGVEFVNSDSPLRVAGQKTTVLEVLAERAPDVPDAVVMPVSSGGHASAAWKALREAEAAGLVDDPPRLYLVQAAACAPVAAAFDRGDEEVVRLAPDEVGETVAYSIANPDPPSGTRALAAARATGGAVLAADDDDIGAARDWMARAGFRVEAASATPLAALGRLRDAGEIEAGEDVVLVATGAGYGDDAPPESVETVRREGLAGALRAD